MESFSLRVEGDGGTIQGVFALVAIRDVTVSPPTRNFGDVEVGTQAAPRVITVTNVGDRNALVAQVVLRGVDRAQYVLNANNCNGVTLRPGASCTFAPAFSPNAGGLQRAIAVVLTPAAPGGHLRAPLRGTGAP